MASNKPTYIGFSTVNSISPPYTLTDIELIKQDLLNAFKTVKGERVMLPNYGTNIYRYMFDPLDSITTRKIIEDAKNVILQEPRVELNDIAIREGQYTITLEIVLTFLPSESADTLFIDYQKQNQEEI